MTPPDPKTPAGEALSDARALKPCGNSNCPGSDPHLETDCGNDARVYCRSCGRSTGWIGDDRENIASKLWNATPPASDAGAGLRVAAERLLTAMTTRALRGRDHVPSMRDEQDAASALRKALADATDATDAAASGARFVLVPVEPTEAMLSSMLQGEPSPWNKGTRGEFYGTRENMASNYAAMLAAAPKVAVPAGETYGKWHVMLLGLVNAIHRDGGEKTQAIGIQASYEQALAAAAPKVASDTGAGLRTMLQEAHDTLHECTAVLRADDCRKVAAVMERIRDVLATPTDATDGATVASEAAGLREAAVLRSAVRRILARCEAVEDENSDQLEKEQTEASSGFLRGERSLAKSLRRELHDLNREALGTISPDLEVWISGNAGRAEAVKHGADTYGDDDLAEGSAA